MKQFKSWLVLAGAVFALAACGGGGGGDTGTGQANPLDGLPSEATQSVSGWIAFLSGLIKATAAAEGAEDREPVVPATAPSIPPVDDEGEPAAPT